MKAMTAAAVATATMASSISFAQPAMAAGRPSTLPGGLRYAQLEDAPQLNPALKSNLSSAQQADPPIAKSVSPQAGEEVKQMISRPKTAVEFARNFKVIFDGDLLLQDGFYAEAYLKDIFSLEKVSVIDSNSGVEQQFSISGSVSDSIFPRIKVSEFFGGSTPGANFVGGRRTRQSGSVTAGLNFRIYEGGPDFDAAVKLFAVGFLPVPRQPSPHGGPPPATAPHGNETWRYQQVDGRVEKSIVISFNSTGKLSNVLIEINKDK